MKRKAVVILCYTLTGILLLCLLSIFVLPRLLWEKMPETPLTVWVVDKTVPNTEYREHKGLFWALKSLKVTDEATGLLPDYEKDYYGAVPISKDRLATRELPKTVKYPDLIYLADTYGVYKDDYFSDNIEGARSELLYGGMNDEEMETVKANLGGGNTIIGEFNIASAPTNLENRGELGEIFHLSWKGWNGRYFKDLTNGVEVPAWTVKSYEAANSTDWKFSGEGYVLVSDENRIVVLENGTDVGKKGMRIAFSEACREEFGSAAEAPYEYWFEFIEPDSSTEVLATYSLDLTEKGAAKLESSGLPAVFPAIVRSEGPLYTSYYCAGDFADATISPKYWNVYGFAKLKSALTLSSKGDNANFYWDCYVPMITKIVGDLRSEKAGTLTAGEELQYRFRTQGTSFQLRGEDGWKDFFAKGVNLGSSVPGKWFTEFSRDESLYTHWLSQIAGMNANSVRVYTLMPPQFYTAFADYNKKHPEAPLWLFQEIWPEENPKNDDYLLEEYNEAYREEIVRMIDAMHGNANIPQRTGRAYGLYSADVSPYIAGYLVGRELEPEEVLGTNEANDGFSWNGEYLSGTNEASPTEAWLAMSCDSVLSYETETYHSQHPVGIVSWPTLDPLSHDSEWNAGGDKMLEYNDKAVVDINHIAMSDSLVTGFFGGYHIYPNYPDFMNNEESYADYTDEQGSFRYGGYLREFLAGHSKYPALVAEFGLATGMGNAHSNPDGYHHGGMTEEEQGTGIVRMMEAIRNEGAAGGLIFEWADEWAKKTWTTEPFLIPFDRNPLWHNAVDPEQNYGILAMETADTRSEPYAINGNGVLSGIALSADETWLTIRLTLTRALDLTNEKLIVGIDTYDRASGELRYSADLAQTAPSGMEFIIDIKDAKQAALLAHPGYNASAGKFASYPSAQGLFEEMISLTNKERVTAAGKKIPAVYFNESRLNYGTFTDNSKNHWEILGDEIRIRIPWTRINVTDPSSETVLWDTRESALHSGGYLTKTTDGILVSGVVYGAADREVLGTAGSPDEEPFTWETWDVPAYRERLKSSYAIIREYFEKETAVND